MEPYISWIRRIPFSEASGKLRTLYERIRGPGDKVDNIMMVHSLRPHTMEGHMALYKSVLHHSGNSLPRWLLEAAGVYVSILNCCAYCLEHHHAGLKRLLEDDERADEMRAALEANRPELTFQGRELSIMRYAEALTRAPAEVAHSLLEAMREAGMEDGEILEVNQVVSYFAYANRTVLGLGVTTEGDVLGLSPSEADDPDDWGHR